MHPDDKAKLTGAALFGAPAATWLLTALQTAPITNPKIHGILAAAQSTPENPLLMGALAGGFALGGLGAWAINRLGRGEFQGAPFRRFLRGTRIVSPGEIKRRTDERKPQVTIAGIPMPTDSEPRHTMLIGSTGTGKSVGMREIAYSALRRGDRIVVLDPNGDMLSKFHRTGDFILNPYDQRSAGWSIFNEIRSEYDYERYARSIIADGRTGDEQFWREYGRLIVMELMKELHQENPSIKEVLRLGNIAPMEELRDFLTGTVAESVFSGPEGAIRSARFTISSSLAKHTIMPAGDFSIRNWLESDSRSNLFISWREDMAPALRPLISAWADVVFTSILSLPEDPNRRLWVFLDELGSLEKLPSLKDALTKGRKAGLRVVAGIQSTAQIDEIYGKDGAQTLMSCFRNMVVLGGSKLDAKTCEYVSLGLGEHEVERDNYSKTRTNKGTSTGKSLQRVKERVVSPAEISALPDLSAYIAFAGDLPIARAKFDILKFKAKNLAFEERDNVNA